MTEQQIPETVTDAIEVDATPDSEVMRRVADALLQSGDEGPTPTIVLSESASDTPLAARRR